MFKLPLFRRNSGQSLVSVLVSIAISGIVITVMLQITAEQNKSIKYFTQKSDLLELKNTMVEALANPDSCDWQFTSGNPKINTNNLLNQSIQFQDLHMGNSSTSPKLVSVNSKISGLRITSITYKNIISTGTPGRLRGDIEIAFDPSTAARPIAPLKIKKFITVNTTDPANAQSVMGCTSENTITSVKNICRLVNMISQTNSSQTQCCNPDEILMSVHGPEDQQLFIGWSNNRCASITGIGVGNKIQLRCCE